MTQRSLTLRWLAPAVILYVAGFVAAAFYDMTIDQAVYSPHNTFAVIMEAIGWLPAFVPVVMMAMLYTKPVGKSRLMGLRCVLSVVVATLGTALIYYNVYGYFEEREFLHGFSDPWSWCWLGLGIAVFAFGYVKILRLAETLRQRLTYFAVWASGYFVAHTIVINLIKKIWQRTRFDDMVAAGSFEAFTPWWQPFGNGGSSFPSGHTANAAGIFVLVLLCDIFPSWNRRQRLVYAVCWGYIAAMATARILIGRHFLSDTLAASAVLAGLLYALRRLPAYDKGLRALRQHPMRAIDDV